MMVGKYGVEKKKKDGDAKIPPIVAYEWMRNLYIYYIIEVNELVNSYNLKFYLYDNLKEIYP